jgi:hypothetical protein
LGVTHWSARLLAGHLGISFASVARIWREWKLQPWRRETFKFSTDPDLDAKVRDVVGLYLNPPHNAVIPTSSSSTSSNSSKAYPQVKLHVLADNYATHMHPAVKAWLARNPRVAMHFTPTPGSWLNLVEVIFGIITRQAIRRGAFTSRSKT